MKKLQHIHILVKGHINKPEVLNLMELQKWLIDAVEEQGLEPITTPTVVYVDDEGNEGPTGSVNIKTSHMAFHIWDQQGIIQADLYTCGPLNVQLFLNTFSTLDPVRLEYLVIDRAEGFKIVQAGVVDTDKKYDEFDLLGIDFLQAHSI